MKFLKLSLLAPAMFAVILSVPGTRSTPVPSKEDLNTKESTLHSLFRRKGGGGGGYMSGYSDSDYSSSSSGYSSYSTSYSDDSFSSSWSSSSDSSSWSSPSTSDWSTSWFDPWTSPSTSWGWPGSSSSSSPSYSKPKTPGTSSNEGFHLHQLFRRKGGGRGGGGGGGSGGRGGKVGGGMSSSGTRRRYPRPLIYVCGVLMGCLGRTSPKSNLGGSTKGGSGTPQLSSGYYSGGAKVPYTSGLHSPSGITPFFLGFGVAWFPLWMASHPHGYYVYHLNRTLPTESNAYTPNNTTATYPVLCFCEKYGVCGCDDIMVNRTTATNETVRWNTTYALWNGTGYSLLNGTLANGTTAPGGTENSGASLNGLGWVLYASCILAGLYLVN